jgi:hypothetical protein
MFLKDLGAKPPGGVTALAQQIKQARAESPDTLRRFLESRDWVEVPFLFSNRSDNADGGTTLAAMGQRWRISNRRSSRPAVPLIQFWRRFSAMPHLFRLLLGKIYIRYWYKK